MRYAAEKFPRKRIMAGEERGRGAGAAGAGERGEVRGLGLGRAARGGPAGNAG